jgi:hypothetical protein
MKTIDLRSVDEEPNIESVHLYPDFLIGRLLKKGIGRIEAERSLQHDGKVDFIFTSRQSGSSELVVSIHQGAFRPLLARFGPRCGADDMLYTGHTLFACEYECERVKRLHRFSLYICNEPTMAIWMKLYLYCIDGVWPMRKESP